LGKLTLDNSDYKNKIDESKQRNEELKDNTKDLGNKSKLIWGAIATAIL
jgi:cell division protein FtsL